MSCLFKDKQTNSGHLFILLNLGRQLFKQIFLCFLPAGITILLCTESGKMRKWESPDLVHLSFRRICCGRVSHSASLHPTPARQTSHLKVILFTYRKKLKAHHRLCVVCKFSLFFSLSIDDHVLSSLLKL